MFSQSKVITSPNVTFIFYLLLNQLNTSIVVLSRYDRKTNEHREINDTQRSI